MKLCRLVASLMFGLGLLVPASAFAQQAVSSAAAWNPDQRAQGRLAQECGMVPDGSQRRQCVDRVMSASGASQEAIAFADAQDGLLYISGWRPGEPPIVEAGNVAVAQVVCTFVTNFNCGYSYIIVNGSPNAIPVSIDPDGPGFHRSPGSPDVAALWDDIRSDPVYQQLTSDPSEPFATNVWPGEDLFVDSESEADGGQKLIFWSAVKTCHACPAIGKINVAYHFDSSGAFQGRSLESVVAI
jgi:hypothetical protein